MGENVSFIASIIRLLVSYTNFLWILAVQRLDEKHNTLKMLSISMGFGSNRGSGKPGGIFCELIHEQKSEKAKSSYNIRAKRH